MESFGQLVRLRRSVRGFIKDRRVPQPLVLACLETAKWAPSNCNIQPWQVWIAQDRSIEELRVRMTGALDSGDFGDPEDPIDSFCGEYRDLQVDCGKRLYSAMGIERDDHGGRLHALRRNYEFFDAPAVAIMGMDKRFGLGVALDVGMFAQTFMLALTENGVACCAQASLRHYPAILRDVLGIPDEVRILCGVAFGYEATDIDANQVRQDRVQLDKRVVFCN